MLRLPIFSGDSEDTSVRNTKNQCPFSVHFLWIRAEKRPHDPHLMIDLLPPGPMNPVDPLLHPDGCSIFFVGVVPRKILEHVPVESMFSHVFNKIPRQIKTLSSAPLRKAFVRLRESTGDLTHHWNGRNTENP